MTEDCGQRWQRRSSGTTKDLHGVAMVFPDLYAVGEDGTILRSLDAGQTWEARTSGTTKNLRAVN